METTAYTSDNIITRSYEEYHQVILNYITYRIAHRYEAEDLTQDVFVRLMDYKQMLRPDTVKYFLFTIARNIVIDYIRRYYKKQEIDGYLYRIGGDELCVILNKYFENPEKLNARLHREAAKLRPK